MHRHSLKPAQIKFVVNFQEAFIKMFFKRKILGKSFSLYLDKKYKTLNVFYCGMNIKKLVLFCIDSGSC